MIAAFIFVKSQILICFGARVSGRGGGQKGEKLSIPLKMTLRSWKYADI